MEFEGDKNIKKLWKEFKDYSPLMKEGTKSKKISDAINLAFEKKLHLKIKDCNIINVLKIKKF